MQIKTLFYLLKHLGPGWLVYRCYYAIAHKLGLFERRMPSASWQTISDHQERIAALAFMPDKIDKSAQSRLKDWDNDSASSHNVTEEAEAVLRGEFLLFSYHHKQLGFPPDWHQNAMSGAVYDRNLHWSKIADFGQGDIKCVWEANRFPWAFALARAYARTGDERFAEGFWLLFENWLDENPPNRGVNWKCGQEAAFRLFATCFARRALACAQATTPERLLKWRKFVAFTAVRIAGNLNYALSQNNNHGISECVGLYTAAMLLPGLPDAAKYVELAEKELIGQLDSLVYEDGAFSQHSTVYHRVVMHDLALYLAIKKTSGSMPDHHILQAATRALQFMVNITDLTCGQALLHGPNDGANILLLANSDFLDFRPSLLLLASLLNCQIDMPCGKHDEALFWFSLAAHKDDKVMAQSADPAIVKSGWFIFTGENSRLFCYAPEKFIHRPAQADLLHVDLWWKGIPITLDPGSYSYNSGGQFSGMFCSTRVHNTVCVNDSDQLKKVSRFLYLPWPRAKTDWCSEKRIFTATHNAYRENGVLHTRKIQQKGPEGWLIEDTVAKTGILRNSQTISLHWLLADYECEFNEKDHTLVLHTPAGFYRLTITTDAPIEATRLIRADKVTDAGWWSPYYYCAEPALSIEMCVKSRDSVKFISYFEPV
ncbi:MAG: alginate lyase family protein [Erysipelotrichia bacterium]|nr:alginate lyase family protein [Erysipelotrichia bacterium]